MFKIFLFVNYLYFCYSLISLVLLQCGKKKCLAIFEIYLNFFTFYMVNFLK